MIYTLLLGQPAKKPKIDEGTLLDQPAKKQKIDEGT